MNKTAFIICNGASRIDFDLLFLKNQGTIFGCNAIYKQDDNYIKYDIPDYVVCMEGYRIEEIQNSPFPKNRQIIPENNELNEEISYWREVSNDPNLSENIQTPRSNAGMLAMKYAIKMGYNNLYILGFDCVIEGDLSISNLMDGKPETRCSYEDTKRRCVYFKWFTHQHPKIKFKLVLSSGVKELRNVLSENVSYLFYNNLMKNIKKDNQN